MEAFGQEKAKKLSASSWGCELKCESGRRWKDNSCQPLREAVSWNVHVKGHSGDEYSQPLREAVSWNSNPSREVAAQARQPLREAVSWNDMEHVLKGGFKSQPLREAVSWNYCSTIVNSRIGSQPLREAVSWNVINAERRSGCAVSLFVRLWVEIDPKDKAYKEGYVSLFVRLWVEIWWSIGSDADELCQPLREAVSWNVTNVCLTITV